jgi:hypothetical protein
MVQLNTRMTQLNLKKNKTGLKQLLLKEKQKRKKSQKII